jgi:hypothetical protein
MMNGCKDEMVIRVKAEVNAWAMYFYSGGDMLLSNS